MRKEADQSGAISRRVLLIGGGMVGFWAAARWLENKIEGVVGKPSSLESSVDVVGKVKVIESEVDNFGFWKTGEYDFPNGTVFQAVRDEFEVVNPPVQVIGYSESASFQIKIQSGEVLTSGKNPYQRFSYMDQNSGQFGQEKGMVSPCIPPDVLAEVVCVNPDGTAYLHFLSSKKFTVVVFGQKK